MKEPQACLEESFHFLDYFNISCKKTDRNIKFTYKNCLKIVKYFI